MATTQQLKVFVSHSHEDDAFCRALVQGLRQAGADVWYDEHNFGSGRLGPTIERELRACPVFIVILSPAALRSQWVEDETRWAYGLLRKAPDRLIVPITAATIEEDNIWLFLQDFKRTEAPGLQPLPIAEALRRACVALALTPTGVAHETPAPVDFEPPKPPKPPEPTEPTESAEELLARGNALLAQGKYSEALVVFERATQRAPHNVDAWGNLADALNMLKRWQNALEVCERATALDSSNYFAWYHQGNALRGLMRHDEALVAYDRALALAPKNRMVWRGKAAALEALGRYADALDAYEQGSHPRARRDWQARARCLRALGRTAEADEAERRAKELGG